VGHHHHEDDHEHGGSRDSIEPCNFKQEAPAKPRPAAWAILTFTALSASILAGCAAPEGQDAAYHPPMLFVANNQAHILLLVGGESGIPWANVTVSASGPCSIEVPTEGEIVYPIALAVKGDLSRDCTFTVAYQGATVGSYNFGPAETAKALAAREATAQAVEATPTPAAGKPQDKNGTAPP
jgi:hypothetical protein